MFVAIFDHQASLLDFSAPDTCICARTHTHTSYNNSKTRFKNVEGKRHNINSQSKLLKIDKIGLIRINIYTRINVETIEQHTEEKKHTEDNSISKYKNRVFEEISNFSSVTRKTRFLALKIEPKQTFFDLDSKFKTQKQ